MSKNYFAGIKQIFSADRDVQRHDFELDFGNGDSRPCWVEVRPMNAYNESKLRGLGQKLEVDLTSGSVKDVTVTPDQAEQELHVMLWSIHNMQLVRQSKSPDGDPVYSIVNWPRDETSRKEFLKGLTPDLWRALVIVCSEVNGLDPFGGASDE